MFSRRELIKGTAVVGGVALVGGLGFDKCNAPKLNTWVATIVGALTELKPLLPAQATLLTSIAKVASDFNTAYQAGKFADAVTIFDSLSGLIDQLIADVGAQPSQQVMIIISLIKVAIKTIAVILHNQADDPAVTAAIGPVANSKPIATVRRLSEPGSIYSLFKAVR